MPRGAPGVVHARAFTAHAMNERTHARSERAHARSIRVLCRRCAVAFQFPEVRSSRARALSARRAVPSTWTRTQAHPYHVPPFPRHMVTHRFFQKRK